jgi:hypothetical protein
VRLSSTAKRLCEVSLAKSSSDTALCRCSQSDHEILAQYVMLNSTIGCIFGLFFLDWALISRVMRWKGRLWEIAKPA